MSQPANSANYCNNANIDQSYCSRVATTNCFTPTGSLETSSIQCISGDYDYLLTVPAIHCGAEVADYFNVHTERGFSHVVPSKGVVTTYMSVAFNSTGIVTLAEASGGGCSQSFSACLNYFMFATKTWGGFDCSFTGIGPTWTPTCYPFKVQLLNSSATLVSVVGATNETFSRLKNGNTLYGYIDSGIGVPCL